MLGCDVDTNEHEQGRFASFDSFDDQLLEASQEKYMYAPQDLSVARLD